MEQFFMTTVKILILLNPFAVLSTFLPLTSEHTAQERLWISIKSGIAVMAAGTLLFFCGQAVFSLLGIDVYLFKVGGGVILMICAVMLVWGGNNRKKQRPAYSRDSAIAVVPIAIPMAVGPGTAAGLIVIGLERGDILTTCIQLLALLTAAVLLTALLALSTQAERIFKQEWIMVITKLSGLFLSAIAAKMIIEGVRYSLIAE
ncbi:MAG: MarC family protein [Lentisphaerae bacterium]|nr:MarC family protein [Lentisphaerota bacterium]